MKSRKAKPIQPWTESTSAFSRSGRLRAEGGDQRAEERQDQDPEEHRALVVPPHAGDLVEERLRDCEFSTTLRTEKSETTWACTSAAKASPTSRNSVSEAGAATAIRWRSPLQRAVEGHGRLDQRQEQRQHQRESGRARRSFRLRPPWHRRFPPSRPSGLAPSAPRPPPWACSARRAWPAPCRRRACGRR